MPYIFGNTATRSFIIIIIIYEEGDHFGSHQSVRCWRSNTQYYPGCPAKGQILQRGHVWNMAVCSLMTHSTINTLQRSGSARGYGRVYWLLALVPQRTLSRPADRLPDWSWRRSSLTRARSYGGAQPPRRRRLTHIAAPKWCCGAIPILSGCPVNCFLSFSLRQLCKLGRFFTPRG